MDNNNVVVVGPDSVDIGFEFEETDGAAAQNVVDTECDFLHTSANKYGILMNGKTQEGIPADISFQKPPEGIKEDLPDLSTEEFRSLMNMYPENIVQTQVPGDLSPFPEALADTKASLPEMSKEAFGSMMDGSVEDIEQARIPDVFPPIPKEATSGTKEDLPDLSRMAFDNTMKIDPYEITQARIPDEYPPFTKSLTETKASLPEMSKEAFGNMLNGSVEDIVQARIPDEFPPIPKETMCEAKEDHAELSVNAFGNIMKSEPGEITQPRVPDEYPPFNKKPITENKEGPTEVPEEQLDKAKNVIPDHITQAQHLDEYSHFPKPETVPIEAAGDHQVMADINIEDIVHLTVDMLCPPNIMAENKTPTFPPRKFQYRMIEQTRTLKPIPDELSASSQPMSGTNEDLIAEQIDDAMHEDTNDASDTSIAEEYRPIPKPRTKIVQAAGDHEAEPVEDVEEMNSERENTVSVSNLRNDVADIYSGEYDEDINDEVVDFPQLKMGQTEILADDDDDADDDDVDYNDEKDEDNDELRVLAVGMVRDMPQAEDTLLDSNVETETPANDADLQLLADIIAEAISPQSTETMSAESLATDSKENLHMEINNVVLEDSDKMIQAEFPNEPTPFSQLDSEIKDNLTDSSAEEFGNVMYEHLDDIIQSRVPDDDPSFDQASMEGSVDTSSEDSDNTMISDPLRWHSKSPDEMSPFHQLETEMLEADDKEVEADEETPDSQTVDAMLQTADVLCAQILERELTENVDETTSEESGSRMISEPLKWWKAKRPEEMSPFTKILAGIKEDTSEVTNEECDKTGSGDTKDMDQSRSPGRTVQCEEPKTREDVAVLPKEDSDAITFGKQDHVVPTSFPDATPKPLMSAEPEMERVQSQTSNSYFSPLISTEPERERIMSQTSNSYFKSRLLKTSLNEIDLKFSPTKEPMSHSMKTSLNEIDLKFSSMKEPTSHSVKTSLNEIDLDFYPTKEPMADEAIPIQSNRTGDCTLAELDFYLSSEQSQTQSDEFECELPHNPPDVASPKAISGNRQSFISPQNVPKDVQAAQLEWDNVEQVTARFETTEEPVVKKEAVVKVAELIKADEVIRRFQSMDLTEYKARIKTSVTRHGFFSFCFSLFGPPTLQKDLRADRDLVFCMGTCPFINDDPVHFRVLKTIYRKFTGSKFDPQRFGSHWELIGFQGNDPATDLRGTGFLALLHLLYLITNPRTYPLACDIYKLSQDEVQNFPLALMSINITRLTIQSLREDLLNKECNSRLEVINTVNEFYAACFLRMYRIWKYQHKTISDSGFVLRDVETFVKKHPRRTLVELGLHLEARQKKVTTPSHNYKTDQLSALADCYPDEED